MSNKPSLGINDDYAYLDAKNASFYYGYEQTLCKKCGARNCKEEAHYEDLEWCFVATFDGQKVVIPQSKLGASQHGNMEDYLMMGIGWILAKYKLVIHDPQT